MTRLARLVLPGLAALLLAGCVAAAPVGQPYGSPVAASPGMTVAGTTCYAGAYVCPLQVAQPAGAMCSCPALGAPSYGTVR